MSVLPLLWGISTKILHCDTFHKLAKSSCDSIHIALNPTDFNQSRVLTQWLVLWQEVIILFCDCAADSRAQFSGFVVLGARCKCRFLDPIPDLLNQNVWGGDPKTLAFNSSAQDVILMHEV